MLGVEIRTALLVALRRRTLSTLTAAVAILPILCAMTIWIIDAHSELSPAQRQSQAFGDRPYRARFNGVAVSADRAAQAEAALQAENVDPIRVVENPELTIQMGGRNVFVKAIAKPWTREFRDAFHARTGRAPTRIDEVAVTPALAARGLSLGSTIQVGSQMRTVVGVATTPGWTGHTEAVFLSDVTGQDLQRANILWVMSRHPSAELVERHHLFVDSPSELRATSTVLSNHPVILGGTVLLTSVGLLLCVRSLTGRTVERTARALVGVGASTRQIARVETLGAVIPAAVGTTLGWGLIALEYSFLPDAVAAANNIERPHLVPPLLALGALSIAFIVLTALPAWRDGIHAARNTTNPAPRDTVVATFPRSPVTSWGLGIRSVLHHRRRSRLLGFIAAALCLLTVNIVAITITADTQKLEQEAREGGVRDGAVRVFLRTSDPAMVSAALGSRVKDIRILYHLQVQNKSLPLRGNGPLGMCPEPVLVDDVAGFQTLFGRPPISAEQAALERGDGLEIRPGCGDQVQLVAPDGRPLTDKPIHLVPSTVEERLSSQYGAVLLRRAATSFPAQIVPLAVIGDIADDSPHQREQILVQLASIGVPSNTVTFGGIPHEPPPLVVLFVVAEALVLMLAVTVVSALTMGAEERGTHRALTSLGMPKRKRAIVQFITFGLPLVTGLLAGTVGGLVFAVAFTELVMHHPPVLSPLAYTPWVAVLLLPLLAWFTTPAD